MPETNECYAHWLLNTKMMEAAPENTSWHVRALWADATSAEHRSSASDSACEGESRLGQGLVQPLDASCKAKRGVSGSENAIWPPMFI